MALTYAEVALPLATPQLEAWLASVHPPELFEEFNAWAFEGNSLQFLPTPNLPEPPPFRLGVLHWPTGATRPAWFHFVCGDVVLDQIRAFVGDPMTPAPLAMSDGRTGKLIQTDMYMLPPRPLSEFGTVTTPLTSTVVRPQQDGYLVTLVDKRFYWHWKRGVITTPLSWTHLFSQLATILGSAITVDTIPSAFLTPTRKWRSYYQPAATILDAAAEQVGQRVVVGLDGAVRTVNWETARTESNLQVFVTNAEPVQAGGLILDTDIARYVPAEVRTVFGGSTAFTPRPQAPFVVNTSLASLTMTEYGSSTGVANTSGQVYADLTYNGTNLAQVVLWAIAATTDWYGWRLADPDLSYPGIEPWEPTGWEDWVEWTYQKREPHPYASTVVCRGEWSDFPAGGIPPLEIEYRANCIDGVLIVEYTTDDGETWTTAYSLGIPCSGGDPPGSGGPTTPVTGGPGCSAGWTEENCLLLSVTAVRGDCDDIPIPQDIILRWNGAAWEGEEPFLYSGGSGTVILTIDGEPTLYIAGQRLVLDGGGLVDGVCYLQFVGGGVFFCGVGTSGTLDDCDPNLFVVRITCIPCPTYNCVASVCVDPGDGTGVYDTLAACEAVCVTYNCEVLDVSPFFQCTAVVGAGGTYPTLAACNAACGVATACCPDDAMPGVLIARFSGGTGDCTCMDGVELTLTYDSGAGDWRVLVAFPCNLDATSVRLSCTGTQWGLDFVPDPPATSACSGASSPTTESSCTPFSVTFTGVTVANCCTGTIDVVVTET